MTVGLSPNAQAILLLTAPLIAGQGSGSADLLTLAEYNSVARRLQELKREPADLLSANSAGSLDEIRHLIDVARLRALLARGFLLSSVVEQWRDRAIWVVSRADPDYPSRLRVRLKEDAPAVIYGCGNLGLLEEGGLAVVGSRDAPDASLTYARNIGQLAASAGKIIVSGGARGVDQAAMLGAIERGGRVIGVVSDSLQRAALKRDNRDLLLCGKMLLVSPYDPNAGFNVGNAMRRNKLIYAVADAALVVDSDLNRGGTWAGAAEQLDRLHMVPVYVRSSGQASAGLSGLRGKGARPWPELRNPGEFGTLMETPMPATTQARLPLLLEG